MSFVTLAPSRESAESELEEVQGELERVGSVLVCFPSAVLRGAVWPCGWLPSLVAFPLVVGCAVTAPRSGWPMARRRPSLLPPP